jgi:ABC-type polysaccharide/polyol phosphate export permease
MGHAAPIYDSSQPRRLIRDEFGELIQYKDLVGNLVRRNVTSRYKRSVLGILWTLLDPLFTMIVMAVVFGALFETAIPRFSLFLLSGIVIWNFISQSSTQAIADLMYGGSLMNQVYMPRSVYAFAAIGTGLANLGFAMIPLTLLMLITGAPVSWALLFLPISILIVSIFALGLGLIMSAFSVFFADVLNIQRILMQLLMWMSGIFYSLESLPERVRTIIGLAPTYHMVTVFRAPLYLGELPPLISILYASGIAVALFVAGLWVFMRMSDAIAYRV